MREIGWMWEWMCIGVGGGEETKVRRRCRVKYGQVHSVAKMAIYREGNGRLLEEISNGKAALVLAKSMACPNLIYSNRGNSRRQAVEIRSASFQGRILDTAIIRPSPKFACPSGFTTRPSRGSILDSIVSPTHAKIPFTLAQRTTLPPHLDTYPSNFQAKGR
jgi:hypothetical protein